MGNDVITLGPIPEGRSRIPISPPHTRTAAHVGIFLVRAGRGQSTVVYHKQGMCRLSSFLPSWYRSRRFFCSQYLEATLGF